MTRLDWATIINVGASIVYSYSTPVTLRQLHYRLVAANVGGYVNRDGCYKQLSSRTAELRRCGDFPSLADNGRSVSRPDFRDDALQALEQMSNDYRLDRTRGQDYQTWLLFEKATLHEQFWSWTSRYGIPIAALRGYSSETLEAEVCDDMYDDGRPVVVWYVGDLDPEGEDIERNFQAQAERRGVDVDDWTRLAVTPAQIAELGLVPNPGKSTSSRAPGFIRKYGQLFQIETEAVDPDVLQQLVLDAVRHDDYFDEAKYQAVLKREAREQQRLQQLVEAWDDDEDDQDEDDE
jgi:hypothetical protein